MHGGRYRESLATHSGHQRRSIFIGTDYRESCVVATVVMRPYSSAIVSARLSQDWIECVTRYHLGGTIELY